MPNNNKQGRFSLKRVIKRGLIGLFVIIGLIIILMSPLLKIGHVEITGNTTIPRETVLKIADLHEPLNVFTTSSSAVKERLERDLRIASVQISKTYPTKLNLKLVERTPVAVVNTSYGFVDIDSNGIVTGAYKNMKKQHKPLISGIVLEDVYTGDKVENKQLMTILTYLHDLHADYLAQIAQVNIDNNRVEAVTAKGGRIILGELTNPQLMAQKTNDFFDDIKVSSIPIDYIDFSYTKPVLKLKQ